MKAKDIRRFFEELDRRLNAPVRVILTGGAAAVLQGVARVTYDIDFELDFKKAGANRDTVQKAIQDAGQSTGITPHYAEDIDRWSAISLPAKRSRPFLKIGKVDVRLLDPGLWAIGKLARYLSSDIDDLRTVLKTAKNRPGSLAILWGKALGMSPTSSAQALFHRQVESFLDSYAREIWGPNTDPVELKRLFITSARALRVLPRKGGAS